MKKLLPAFFLFLLSFPVLIAQEIPNPGFETWNGNIPEGWAPLNFPGFAEPITPSSDSHSGSTAAKLEVLQTTGGVMPPVLSSNLFPVSQRYGSLQGFYKFSPVNNSQELIIAVFFYKNSELMGGGSIGIFETASTYTQFAAPITFFTEEQPDSAQISVVIGDTSEAEVAGSVALLDDLSFGGVVGVDDEDFAASDFKLNQNYPNPFNPATIIEYSIPYESFVELKVYDMLGNEISVLVNENQSAGNYKQLFAGENLASGTYFVQLRAGNFVKSFKMLLMK